MVFIDTMKTFFLKNHKQHQSIFGANSIKEFPRRRASLKKNSDERIESLEDAASHEKRENRQVCAGKFRSGARILARNGAQSVRFIITQLISHHQNIL